MGNKFKGVTQPRGGSKSGIGAGSDAPAGPGGGGSTGPASQPRIQTIRTPRAEFVILFVWTEPTPSDPDDAAPGTPTT
jgi:hypothetical protein